MLRLKAVEYQSQLCARAFGKHERARARGEDIRPKEHQKRLKMGRPIQAVSMATRQSQQDRLVQDFQTEQLQEIATGVLNPHPVPAAATEQAPNPLCEPSGVLRPAKTRAEPTPAARELRIDAFTAQARLPSAVYTPLSWNPSPLSRKECTASFSPLAPGAVGCAVAGSAATCGCSPPAPGVVGCATVGSAATCGCSPPAPGAVDWLS